MTRDEAIALARRHRLPVGDDWADPYHEQFIAAILEAAGGRWRPIEEAPKDGTECLFWQPGNPRATNGKAVDPRMRVDSFSERWPRARYQCPESPYTHFQPLPPPPTGAGR